jgi:hypothetical protein
MKVQTYWPRKTRPFGSCEYTGDAYKVEVTRSNASEDCFTSYSSDFTDFAFEIQMTLLSGDHGGIDFRHDQVTGNTYYLWISAEGVYALEIWHGTRLYRVLGSGTSSALRPSLNEPNLIAIVARGNNFQFYANRHLVGSFDDQENSFDRGQIGVDAYALDRPPTSVLFKNAKLWIPRT